MQKIANYCRVISCDFHKWFQKNAEWLQIIPKNWLQVHINDFAWFQIMIGKLKWLLVNSLIVGECNEVTAEDCKWFRGKLWLIYKWQIHIIMKIIPCDCTWFLAITRWLQFFRGQNIHFYWLILPKGERKQQSNIFEILISWVTSPVKRRTIRPVGNGSSNLSRRTLKNRGSRVKFPECR